jgi:hypothetical protein
MTPVTAAITVALGVAAGYVVGVLGTLGLLTLSLVLVLALVAMNARIALGCAIAAMVPFLAYGLAFVRCQPTLGRTCVLDDGWALMIAWAGVLLVASAGVAWLARRGSLTSR